MDKSFFRRPGLATLALCFVLVSFTSAQAGAREINRGVEPLHQPVVERTDFVFDVPNDGSDTLNPADQKRLATWFKALNLGYGDHVTLAGTDGSSLGTKAAIADVVGHYGLLIEGEAPVTAGSAPAGGIRVVVSRSVASVPGCPTWRDKNEADLTSGLSDNYGCASARNLAAMMADPRDLVEGHEAPIDPKSNVSGRAIKAYNDKPPTGSGDIKTISAGGS